MFVQIYGATAGLILASAVVGRAICAWVEANRRSSAAPAVGLAALIVLVGAAIKLPGRDITATCVSGVVVVGATGFLIHKRLLRVRWEGVVIVGAALLIASLPFAASGRVGLPGVSLDNDTSNHLLWAETLRSSRMASLWAVQGGYPLGPHSVADAIATLGAMPLDSALTGLIVAVIPITALTAGGLLGADEAPWRRIVVALTCSLAYLFASYYGEGSFKETILALLLLAAVVHVDEVRPLWAPATAGTRWRLVVPVVLLAAGAIYTYSYVAVAWFGLSAVLWIAAEAVCRPTVVRELTWSRLAAAAPWLAATAVLALVLVLPVAGQALSFFHTVGLSPAQGAIPANSLGNLEHPLSVREALGIWLSPDFRVDPTSVVQARELSAFALAVVVFGTVWSIRRRRLLLPATAAACILIWWRSDHSQAPYVTAKALAVASPFIVALGARALLARRAGPAWTRAPLLAAAAAFCGLVTYSSYLVLRSDPVEAPAAGAELASFHKQIGESSVLFLGVDDYASWQLRDAAVSTLGGGLSLNQAPPRPSKAPSPGTPLDFDSVSPSDLNRFDYVVTSNTPYASQPPANFRLVSRGRLYELWKRAGPTPARDILEPPGAPGAVLDCRSPTGRKLSREKGVASVMAPPVTVPGPGLHAGDTEYVFLPLPRGRWEISIQYVSSFKLEVSTPRVNWTMPAYLGRQGPFFAVGAVAGQGVAKPVLLRIIARRPSLLTGVDLFATVPMIAATRLPDTRWLVPLRQACGQYVDWYRVSRPQVSAEGDIRPG